MAVIDMDEQWRIRLGGFGETDFLVGREDLRASNQGCPAEIGVGGEDA